MDGERVRDDRDAEDRELDELRDLEWEPLRDRVGLRVKLRL